MIYLASFIFIVFIFIVCNRKKTKQLYIKDEWGRETFEVANVSNSKMLLYTVGGTAHEDAHRVAQDAAKYTGKTVYYTTNYPHQPLNVAKPKK